MNWGTLMETNNIENKQTQISINIVIENIRNKLSEIILTSGLPSSVLELITKDIYMQTKEASAQIYQKEKLDYEEYLKESAEQ